MKLVHIDHPGCFNPEGVLRHTAPEPARFRYLSDTFCIMICTGAASRPFFRWGNQQRLLHSKTGSGRVTLPLSTRKFQRDWITDIIRRMKRADGEYGSLTVTGHLVRLFIPLLLLFCHASPADPGIALEISKSDRILKVRQGDEIIKWYRVAFGKGGKGSKRKSGDNKTPLGIYRITEFKPDSKFHYFMQINYPNLTDAWYGYKERLITAKEFRRIAEAYRHRTLPPQDTILGGYIGIHGIGHVTRDKLDIHSSHNWTEGCIALKNEEINELRSFVSIGTPVLITE